MNTQRHWLFSYRWSDFPKDLSSGLMVALILIPTCFAYADLAQCPPITGLYTAVASMLVFSLISSSKHVIVGPDAAIALLVGMAIGPFSHHDPSKAATLAALLAAMTGAILVLMSKLKLGLAADFLSHPAMVGFMNGAALIIIASQIGKLTGITLHQENPVSRFIECCQAAHSIHPLTLGIGVLLILILTLCRIAKIPGAIIVFIIASALGHYFPLEPLGVSVMGTMSLSIPDVSKPTLEMSDFPPLVTAATGIALLVFSEGIILGRSVANAHAYRINPDRELLALGIANLACTAVAGFPAGASQTRTLIHEGNGGRSQMASVVAALLTLLAVALCSQFLATLPLVAIAAILTFTGVTLIDTKAYHTLWHQHRFSATVALATTVGVVFLGVIQGILLGVILSILWVLAQVTRPQDALLGQVPHSNTLHDIGDDHPAKTIPGLVVYRFYGPLIFTNIQYFIDRIEWFISEETHPVHTLLIDARAIPTIDITAKIQLHQFISQLEGQGIQVSIAKAHLPFREALTHYNADTPIQCQMFSQLADAIHDYLNQHPAIHTDLYDPPNSPQA